MFKYKNGNYDVELLADGTKIRTIPDGVAMMPIFPESLDIKITNKCNASCAYCHEDSVPEGLHGDLRRALHLLKDLPSGVELAIGGGNPLEHPDLQWFIDSLKELGLVPNMTVNAMHFDESVFAYGCYGIGISYNKFYHNKIKEHYRENCVIHLIAGYHTVEDLERCAKDFKKILILGHKNIGRAIKFNKSNNEDILVSMKDWYRRIGDFFNKDGVIIAFDNLGLLQLNLKRFFTAERWSELFLGADGTHSMYIDFVKSEYAVSSHNGVKIPIDGDIREVFATVLAFNK